MICRSVGWAERSEGPRLHRYQPNPSAATTRTMPPNNARRLHFVPTGFGAISSVAAKALDRPESVSRFNRFRSALSSAADWQRTSRSFSRHLPMISSSLGGTSGLIRTGGTGDRSRMAWKITPEVSPRNGNCPVAI